MSESSNTPIDNLAIHDQSGESSDSESEPDSRQSRLTDFLAIIRSRTGMSQTRSQTQGGDGSSGGLSAADRAALRKQDADRAKRDHDSKKKLPKISEVLWTHKDRKKKIVVQELTRMMRQLNEYLKVDGIRETAFEQDEGLQRQFRRTRLNALSVRDAALPPEGASWPVRAGSPK